jgi:PAS domain-containing protein
LRIQPYRTIENVIEGAVITFVDITGMKRTEMAMKRSEKLLRMTQKLSRIGGWEWDVEKQSMFWTEETYRIHDLESEHVEGLSKELLSRSQECYRAEDRPVILAAFERCLNEGLSYDLDLPFTTTKGRRLKVRLSGEAIREGHAINRVIGFIMDITDRPSSRGSPCPFRPPRAVP